MDIHTAVTDILQSQHIHHHISIGTISRAEHAQHSTHQHTLTVLTSMLFSHAMHRAAKECAILSSDDR